MHTKVNWCTLACSRPHLVLWVELKRGCNYWPAEKGYCYWPAKLLSNGRQDVKVIFFDGSDFIDIPRGNCFTYSINPPKRARSMPNAKDMDDVLEMVNLYAQNIREQFGFHIKPKTIQFDQHPLITHMKALFPKWTHNYPVINEEIDQIEIQNLDEPDQLNDTNEIPKKIRRISEECVASSSNSGRFDSMFDQNHDPSEIGLKELDESIEQMKKFKVFVMNLANTIQALQNELGILKVSHADGQKKNDQLISQLNSVCAERDQTNSDAKNEIEKLKEDHAKAVALIEDRKKRHTDGQTKFEKLLSDANIKMAKIEAEYAAATKEVAEAKAKVKQLKNDRECLRKGLSNSHSMMNELQAKLETNHKRDLDELRQELQTQIESEKNKAQSIIKEKANFKKRCEQIVNNVKAEARKCKGCGDSKQDLFCSPLCCSVYGKE